MEVDGRHQGMEYGIDVAKHGLGGRKPFKTEISLPSLNEPEPICERL